MSVFDKDTFLNQQVTGANETKFTPVPEGEYSAFIDDLGMEEYKDQERGTVPILVVGYTIMDDKLKEDLGLQKVQVQDRVFLDVEAGTGALAFGPNKNVKLGKIREAVNQNDAKKAWNMNMLRGAGPVVLKVTHRFAKNGDGPFANVDRIARGQ